MVKFFTTMEVLQLAVIVSVMFQVRGEVTVQGLNDVEVRPGEEFTLSCTTPQVEIIFCTFTSPAGIPFVMKEGLNYENDRIEYFGSNPKLDCGVKVKNVEDKDNGEWKCQVTTTLNGAAKQGEGSASVTVLKAPTSVFMDPSNDEPLVAVYPRDTEKLITCTADGGRPEPTFSWRIGDRVVKLPVVDTNVEKNPDGTTKAMQQVQYVPKPEHNGKSLYCVVESQGYYQTQLDSKDNEDSILLDIQYQPEANENEHMFYGMNIGEQFVVRIGFKSHPRPEEIRWQMHDGEVVAEGSESPNGRYTAEMLQAGSTDTEGTFTALLTLNSVSEKDGESINTLIIRNALGETEIRFRLGMGEEPSLDSEGGTRVEGLSNTDDAGTGPVIAIVIIVLVILVVIAVAVIARTQGLLCFAVRKEKEEDKEKAVQGEEGSDTESADQPDTAVVEEENELDTPSTATPPPTTESQPRKSVTKKMTSLFSAMKKTVTKKQNLDQDGEEKRDEEKDGEDDGELHGETNGDVAYADLDKSAMSVGGGSIPENQERTEYADVTPQEAQE